MITLLPDSWSRILNQYAKINHNLEFNLTRTEVPTTASTIRSGNRYLNGKKQKEIVITLENIQRGNGGPCP